MNKILKELIDKRFSVYVGGEFERSTNFVGLIKLFTDYGDFFHFSSREQKAYLNGLLKNKVALIDADIYVMFK